jgi:hypothetical protein
VLRGSAGHVPLAEPALAARRARRRLAGPRGRRHAAGGVHPGRPALADREQPVGRRAEATKFVATVPTLTVDGPTRLVHTTSERGLRGPTRWAR